MKNLFILISATLFLAGCAFTSQLVSGTQQSPLPASSFHQGESGNFEGELFVRGYASQHVVDEPFCEEDCPEYDYVSFNVTESSGEGFKNFSEQFAGNSYVGQKAIGLGCLTEDGLIEYENHSDKAGFKSYQVPKSETQKILNSSPENPVTLRLNKLPLSGGRGAPACYSHFTEIKIAN